MFTTANIKKIPENFKKEIFGKFGLVAIHNAVVVIKQRLLNTIKW